MVMPILSEDPINKESWSGSFGTAEVELISEYEAHASFLEELSKKMHQKLSLKGEDKLPGNQAKFFVVAEGNQKRLKDKQILQYLPSKNVLPKYGFPVDIVELKLFSNDDWARSVELSRDMKIAISEYAPGCALVANGNIVVSYALEHIPGKSWGEYSYYICDNCGRFHRGKTAEDQCFADTCDCGNPVQIGGRIPRFIIPEFGFRTKIGEEGLKPVDVRPQKTYTSRIFFSPRGDEDAVFLPEGKRQPNSGVWLEKRYLKNGKLVVINRGFANMGFWICKSCGFGTPNTGTAPKKHQTPWNKECKGMLSFVDLGHEFLSDVLELRFHGSSTPNEPEFWLSMTSALLSGAYKGLNIERGDIDGTLYTFGKGDYKAIVLFDAVPGGAGHVKRIGNNLPTVFREAYNITNNCPNCSPEQSCFSCLRDYSNQFAHEYIARGPVADFLKTLIETIYSDDNENYGLAPLGCIDAPKWLEEQIVSADRVYFLLNPILPFLYSSEYTTTHQWLDIIRRSAQTGTHLSLFLKGDLSVLDIICKEFKSIVIHELTSLLGRFQNVRLYTINAVDEFKAFILMERDGREKRIILRWEDIDINPLVSPSEAKLQISTHQASYAELANHLNVLTTKPETSVCKQEDITKLLQNTVVKHIQEGSRQTWKDWLSEYVKRGVQTITIRDNYLRNDFQIKSIEMFLDFVNSQAEISGNSDKINIIVNSSYNEECQEHQQLLFKKLRSRYRSSRMNIADPMLSDHKDKILEHARSIHIKCDVVSYRIWLERGFDMFVFRNRSDLSKPETLRSYFVIETEK